MEQRSEQWFSERLGCVTASRIADVMARTKSGYGAGRANYMAQLVCERLTGCREDGFINAAMQRGIDLEARARAAYEFHSGHTVIETGFVRHPEIDWVGASPDGLVGDGGLVEIKVPNTATHIATLRGGGIAGKYIKQIHLQMICTDRQWCDFVSFDDRLPHAMQLYVERVELDAKLADEITEEVTVFLNELNETVADLQARYMQKEAA